MIDFVEQRCWDFLNAYGTENANSGTLCFKKIFNDSWTKFLIWFYEIVEESATVRLSNSFQIDVSTKIGGWMVLAKIGGHRYN